MWEVQLLIFPLWNPSWIRSLWVLYSYTCLLTILTKRVKYENECSMWYFLNYKYSRMWPPMSSMFRAASSTTPTLILRYRTRENSWILSISGICLILWHGARQAHITHFHPKCSGVIKLIILLQTICFSTVKFNNYTDLISWTLFTMLKCVAVHFPVSINGWDAVHFKNEESNATVEIGHYLLSSTIH